MSAGLQSFTKRGLTLKPHAEGKVSANATEKSITEANSIITLSGIIDLSPMEAGDEVLIRQYMKTHKGGDYKQYAQQTFQGAPISPLVYITPKTIRYGGKITIQQTQGPPKEFEYFFVRLE